VTGSDENYYDDETKDVLLVKFDDLGNVIWDSIYRSSSPVNDIGFGLEQASDGGYVVGGYTGSEGIILKYNASGNIIGCPSTVCFSPSESNTDPDATAEGVDAILNVSPGPSTSSPNVPSFVTQNFTENVIVSVGQSIGVPLANQDTALDFISQRKPVTLKIAVAINDAGIAQNTQAFMLKFASLGGNATCAAVNSGDYQEVTTSSALRYYDDSRYTSGTGIGADAEDPVHSGRTMKPQTYQEANNFNNTGSLIYADEDGLWQFMLTVDSSSYRGATYCIRVATSGGTLVSATDIAELKVSPDMKRIMRGGNSFDLQGRKNYIAL
jgi:hypothetical protein